MVANTVLNITPTKYDFPKTCRTCLKTTDGQIGFGDNAGIEISIIDELKIMKLKIAPNDGLPQQICKDCADRVKDFFAFRQECERSQEILEEYFNTSTSFIDVKLKVNPSNAIESIELAEQQNHSQITKTRTHNENETEFECIDLNIKNEIIIDDVIIDEYNDDKDEYNNCYNDNNIYITATTTDSMEINDTSIKSLKPVDNNFNEQWLDDTITHNHDDNNFNDQHLTHNSSVNGNVHDLIEDCETISDDYTKIHPQKKKKLNDNKKNSRCKYCKELFSNTNEMELHLKVYHPSDRPHLCPICKKGFSKTSERIAHMETHVKDFDAVAVTPLHVTTSVASSKYLPSTSKINITDVQGCIIERLLLKDIKFSQLKLGEKIQILKIGRPTPDLSTSLTTNTIEKGRAFKRHFRNVYYEQHPWLCASEKLNKMFCWPCILYSADINCWTNHGYNDLRNFSKAKNKHEKSIFHFKACILLQLFVKVNIRKPLTNDNKYLEISSIVTKNRKIMKRYIDVMCSLVIQEFTAIGTTDNSSYFKNYIETTKLLSLYDNTLNLYQQNSKNSLNISNDFQSDLIESLASLVMQSIKLEISECLFVTIILVDEISATSDKSQLSTIVRYVKKSGGIVERFLGYIDVMRNRSTDFIVKHIVNTIETLSCGDKLIAQSYDGSAVTPREINVVQAKIKETYSNALFIHYFDHSLNLVLSQSVSNIKDCKIFFTLINGIAHFLLNSTKRLNALQNIIKLRVPNTTSIDWTYDSGIVNIVNEYRQDLIKFFEEIIEHPENWNSDEILAVAGFLHFLTAFSTNFQLNIFGFIFAHTDILNNILQNKCDEISYCMEKSNEVIEIIVMFQHEFDVEYEKTVNHLGLPKLDGKTQDECREYFKIIFNQIVETIVCQMTVRLERLNMLCFIDLLNPKICQNETTFIAKLITTVKRNYTNIFDTFRLSNELISLYELNMFKHKSIFHLYRYIRDSELVETLTELFKLCTLIMTIPFMKPPCEDNVQIYSRKATVKGKRLSSSLAMLYIEEQQLQSLKPKYNFYNDVIDEFCKKNNEINLIYK